jgi:hypothetical protein
VRSLTVLVYSTASFLSKLRAKKVEKLHNSSFYRKWNIGFRYRERLFPVLSIINTHIFFLALIENFVSAVLKYTYNFYFRKHFDVYQTDLTDQGIKFMLFLPSVIPLWGLSWLWSYGSWIYNYLWNHCISPLKLLVQTLFMAMYTQYHIMW